MHLVLVIALLALTGCNTASDIPKQPDAHTDGAIVGKVGDQLDKADGRVAAAVKIAQENADKPAVVRAETGVALAYLPQPSDGDVAFARQRAAKADPAEYAKAQEYGKRLLAAIDASWAKMEAQQKEALRISALKDAKIKELEAAVSKAKQDIWTYAGVLLVLLGGLSFAFGPKKAGFCLIVAGFACGIFSMLLGTVWFIPSCAGLTLLGGLIYYKLHKDDVAPCPESIK